MMRLQHRIPFTSLLSVPALAGLMALGATFGCSGAEIGDEPGSLGTSAEQIVMKPDYPGQEFKPWGVAPSPSNGVGDPGYCTPHRLHSMILFTRDSNNYIQGQGNSGVGAGSAWTKYGSTTNARKLGGRPACGFVTETTSPHSFILFAKGATAPNGTVDKHLFWSKGSWKVDDSLTAYAPTAVTAFTALDNTQYNTNGNPTVATHDGQLVVAYLNDSGQLQANYWKAAEGTMSATLVHPNLPTGWVGVGAPAIDFAESWMQRFVIFVRATKSGQTKLFETFFENDHFTAAFGGTTGQWQAVTLPPGAPAISSDPGYEYNRNDDDGFEAGTLFYRSGSKFYQVSAKNVVDQFDTATLKVITNPDGTSPNFTGYNPIVHGGVQFEAGHHWVLARATDNKIYMGESLQDYTLDPN